jgi:hypothetical protein
MVYCWELQKEYSKGTSREDCSKDQWKAAYYLEAKLEQSMEDCSVTGLDVLLPLEADRRFDFFDASLGFLLGALVDAFDDFDF